MRLVAVLVVLLGGAMAVADEDAGPDDVSLDVKPVLCIIDRRTPACEIDFLVAWRSAVEGNYCLFNHFERMPLRCWRDDDAGRHEERRTVDESFQYWLTGDDAEGRLAAVTVDVMTTETGDRRRGRRTRHIWDIL